MLKANLFVVVFLGLSGANFIYGRTAAVRQFGFLVGGYIPIAVNDEQLLDATDFAVNKINFAENTTLGENYYQRDKILYAMRQVVAGFNYKVAFLMDQTECAKTDPELSECLYKGLHPLNVNFARKQVCIAAIFQSLTSSRVDTEDNFRISDFECY